MGVSPRLSAVCPSCSKQCCLILGRSVDVAGKRSLAKSKSKLPMQGFKRGGLFFRSEDPSLKKQLYFPDSPSSEVRVLWPPFPSGGWPDRLGSKAKMLDIVSIESSGRIT